MLQCFRQPSTTLKRLPQRFFFRCHQVSFWSCASSRECQNHEACHKSRTCTRSAENQVLLDFFLRVGETTFHLKFLEQATEIDPEPPSGCFLCSRQCQPQTWLSRMAANSISCSRRSAGPLRLGRNGKKISFRAQQPPPPLMCRALGHQSTPNLDERGHQCTDQEHAMC